MSKAATAALAANRANATTAQIRKMGFGTAFSCFLLVSMGCALLCWTLLGFFTYAYLPDNTGYNGYAWLATNWMFIHLCVGGVVLMLLLLDRMPDSFDWMAMLLTAVYCVHQFEEHGLDVYGRKFSWIQHMADILGCRVLVSTNQKGWIRTMSSCGVNEYVVLWANVYTVFGLLVMPLLLPQRFKPFAVLANAQFVASNALVCHVLGSAAYWRYTPGLVSAILITAPTSNWVIQALLNSGKVTRQQDFFLTLAGLGSQVLLVIAPMIAGQRGMLHLRGQHFFQLTSFVVLMPVSAFLFSCFSQQSTPKKKN